MSNDSTSKRPFGLSFPSKPKSKSSTTTTITPINKSCLAAAAFSLDDDDDMDTTTNSSRQINKPPAPSRLALNPKAQRDIEQALEEDPNIYEYDEVYEQVSSTVQQEQRREEKKRLERETNAVREPKYVAGLLEKSKQREKEYEKVQERRIQRERELEGDLYADKEVFVTSAYKAKLAERQADLAREKLEDQREAMLNVFNQDNMDAFYRYQFKVRTGLKRISIENTIHTFCFLLLGEVTILEESEKIKTQSTVPRNARQLRTRTSNEDEAMETTTTTTENESSDMYARAREKHAQDVEREQRQDIKEEPVVDETPKPSSSSSSAAVKVRRINDESTQNFDDEQIEMGIGLHGRRKKAEKKNDDEEQQEIISSKENDPLTSMPIANEKKRQAAETRIERIRRLCEKRTVGDAFDAAKQAYYERQQKRELYKDYIERAE